MSIILALMAAAIASALTYRFHQPASYFYLLDPPTHRSLHSIPTPRSGGVAISIAIFTMSTATWLVMSLPFWVALIILGCVGIATISFLDDCFEVFCGYRFGVHLYATLILFVTPIMPATLGMGLFCTIAVIWMINLYNFMDGMDGFAGAMAIFGFGTYALIGQLEGHTGFAALNLVAAGAAAGFLRYNLPPAKIFMGDAGACTLGFLAGAYTLWGRHLGILSLPLATLIFSPFIVDATVTLTGRIIRLEKIWIGERNHFYHKMLLRIGHRRTLAIEVMIMAATCTTALVIRGMSNQIQLMTVTGWAAAYAAFFVGIQVFSRRVPMLEEMNRDGDCISEE